MVDQSIVWHWPEKAPTDDLIQFLPIVEDKGINLCVRGLHCNSLRLETRQIEIY